MLPRAQSLLMIFEVYNCPMRKQLENHLLTIDELRNENRGTLEHHQNEMKELRDSISKPYLNQLNALNESLETTKKELTNVNKASAEQQHTIEDLSIRIAAALQSCSEANEIVKSKKASIAELKTQLDEERDQRRKNKKGRCRSESFYTEGSLRGSRGTEDSIRRGFKKRKGTGRSY